MNPEKSLEIIQSMMTESKRSFHKVSPYFLIWGLLMSIAGITESIVVYKLDMKQGFAVWGVMGIVGGIISMIYSKRESKNQPAKNFHDIMYNYVWGGFGITLFLVIVLSVINKINPAPYILLLTGLPTFVTGGLAKHTPLKLGGFVFWIAGILAFLVSKEFSGIVFSLAILFGYLVPGYLLLKQEKKANA